jgi:hypothetical protein
LHQSVQRGRPSWAPFQEGPAWEGSPPAKIGGMLLVPAPLATQDSNLQVAGAWCFGV